MGLVALTIVLLTVVPKFEAIFASFGSRLPRLTVAVLQLSIALREEVWPWLLLAALLGGTIALPLVWRSRRAAIVAALLLVFELACGGLITVAIFMPLPSLIQEMQR